MIIMEIKSSKWVHELSKNSNQDLVMHTIQGTIEKRILKMTIRFLANRFAGK